MSSKAPRKLLLLAALALVALAAGCQPVISEQTASQADPAGLVKIVTTICAVVVDPATGARGDECMPKGEQRDNLQFLGGYLVPEDAEPVNVTSDGPIDVPFKETASFEKILESQHPAPPGRKWVAFHTGLLTQVDAVNNPISHVTALFRVPTGVEPLATSFKYETKFAVRIPQSAEGAKEPFSCAVPCFDIPPLENVVTAETVGLRDAVLLGGREASVQAGEKGSVPFTLRYAGATPAGAIRLSASTDGRGLTVSGDPGTINPAASGDTTVGVAVDVAPDAAPGRYDVALTIELPGGATREASGRLVVAPAPIVSSPPSAPPPADVTPSDSEPALPTLGAATLGSRSLRSVVRRGLRIRQLIGTPGTVKWSLAGGLAKAKSRTVAAAGSQSVRLVLSKKAKRRLKGRRGATIVLKTTLVDALGQAIVKRARLRLTR